MDFRDELFFLAITVKMEAEGEPYDGKLGVAFVIVNRGGSLIDTVFRAYQFSSWNTGSPTEQNIDTTPDQILRDCYKAAVSAYFHLVADPIKGATQFLNEEETRRLRGGSLPGWFKEENVTVRIGKHTFLKLS